MRGMMIVAGIAMLLLGNAEAAPPATVGNLPGPAVRIDLQVDSPPRGVLAYVAKGNNPLVVEPDDRVLMDAQLGRAVPPETVFYELVDGWDFLIREFRGLRLNVKVANSGANPERISAIYLSVTESLVERQPTYWLESTPRCCNLMGSRLVFVNFGWSRPTWAKLTFAFAKSKEKTSPRTKTISHNLSSPAEDRLVHEFESDLLALGVDTRKVEALLSNANDNQFEKGFDAFGCNGLAAPACLARIRASGMLGQLADVAELDADEQGELHATIVGQLSYGWIDRDRKAHSITAPFSRSVTLGYRRVVGLGDSGPEPPEQGPTSLTIVDLAMDRSNYQISLPQRGALAPRDRMQLSLLVRSAKSSRHRFRVVVETASGKTIESQEVRLLALTPSATPQSFAEKEERELGIGP